MKFRSAIAPPLVILVLAAQSGSADTHAESLLVRTAGVSQAKVAAQLDRRGVDVVRSSAAGLQVIVDSDTQRRTLVTTPGVRSVGEVSGAFGDAVAGEGPQATGASVIAGQAKGGAGVRIAIIDMGFGTQIPAGQRRGDLPPPARLATQSFDALGGLTGSNAYGAPTDHGEVVAQSVYDFAPKAHYIFVNYHSQADFVAATDWLITQRPDIVVHANNFLDGPFDGTSEPAKAVDRAAAAGVMWFNSAGNYGLKAWHGAWRDTDSDASLDWPADWTITRTGDQAITFHLSWTNAADRPATDLDLIVEKLGGDGTWTSVVEAVERQADGAPTVERISGARPGAGTYRLRVRHVAGPRPTGEMSLYSREDNLPPALLPEGYSRQSVPTPADAAGAIAVGAVDWVSLNLMPYSSRGPTSDGRRKPDLVGPTGTLVYRRGAAQPIGGTSVSAPNVAGAAALILSRQRVAGVVPTAAQVRGLLEQDIADQGEPGPDMNFGLGRVRLDVAPPRMRTLTRLPRRPVKGMLKLSFSARDTSGLLRRGLYIDAATIDRRRVVGTTFEVPVRTWLFPDGRHDVLVNVSDRAGNLTSRVWPIVFDNTRPRLTVATELLGEPAPGQRKLAVHLTGIDTMSRRLVTSMLIAEPSGRPVVRQRFVLIDGEPKILSGRLPVGRYRLRVVTTDDAGNVRRFSRVIRVTPAA